MKLTTVIQKNKRRQQSNETCASVSKTLTHVEGTRSRNYETNPIDCLLYRGREGGSSAILEQDGLGETTNREENKTRLGQSVERSFPISLLSNSFFLGNIWDRRKEMEEQIFALIVSMILIAAVIPLFLWKRRVDARSREEDAEPPQVTFSIFN